jgi:hypothetical protein
VDFTAGALTLSNSQGDSGGTNIAAGSAQYATIKTSSLAANSTITAPSSDRSYRIVNADSTYSLTIKASGQTGVTFLPGTTGLVAFNGTDYEIVGVVGAASATDNAIPKFDGTTGQIIQNTGVTIDDSNNVSGVAQLNATTADLTNIEVTNIKAKDGTSAGSIADSTGVVTLASSVLTTTDINGGTIDGTTIGGASAGAGTFTTLTATGNVTLGNAATDTVTITADVASNIIPSADNTYDLGASGSEWKDLYIDGTANIDSLVANTADINGGTIDGTAIGGASAAAGAFTTLSASGVTTVQAGTVSAPAITTTGDTNTGIFFPAADTIAFSEGGSERMRITSLGAVTIGSTTALNDAVGSLQLTGTGAGSTSGGGMLNLFRPETDGVGSGDNLGSILFFGADTTGNTPTQLAFIRAQASGTHAAGDNPTDLVFGTTADGSETVTERMRIDSSGNLLVGTTSAGAGIGFSTKLAVAYNGDASVIKFDVQSPNVSRSAFVSRFWNSGTTLDNLFIEFITETSYTSRGFIDYNRVGGLVRYNTSSDATLKNIIGDSDGAKSVEILNSTRIREFAWKDDETQKPQIGVIAQELYDTYKGAVSVGGDVEKERDVTEEVEEEYTDENGETQTRTVTKVVGKETYTEYRPWAVDKTAFTFHLVAGWQAHERMIQELKAINDAQAQRIETLEAKVSALEGN